MTTCRPGHTAKHPEFEPGNVAALRLIDQVALEQAEVVRARISGIAQSLRESGVVLRAVDIPRSERPELLSCAGSN